MPPHHLQKPDNPQQAEQLISCSVNQLKLQKPGSHDHHHHHYQHHHHHHHQHHHHHHQLITIASIIINIIIIIIITIIIIMIYPPLYGPEISATYSPLKALNNSFLSSNPPKPLNPKPYALNPGLQLSYSLNS